jgi:hypothetical protein
VVEGLLVPRLVVVDDGAQKIGRALAAAAAALALHAGEQFGVAELLGVALVAVGVEPLLVLARLAVPVLVRLVVGEHAGAAVMLRSDFRQLSWEPRLLLPN